MTHTTLILYNVQRKEGMHVMQDYDNVNDTLNTSDKPVTPTTAVILQPGCCDKAKSANIQEPQEHSKGKKQLSFGKMLAACLVCSILSAFLSTGIFAFVKDSKDRKNSAVKSTPSDYGQDINNENDDKDEDGNSSDNNTENDNSVEGSVSINVETVTSPATAVAKKVSPSIVGIRVTTVTNYGPYGNYESSGEGSGVIYTANGYIITNYHVIKAMMTTSGENNPNSSMTVFLYQDTSNEYKGSVVGYDQGADLAVIKINATGLPAIEIGNSDSVSVGDIAIAIGNPGGLEFMGSTSQGIISGLNRTIQTEDSYEDLQLIQTDAAINPGNSGGALCDVNGKLIGINSVKLVETGYESMGFAIPSNDVVRICNDIIENGFTASIYLGLEFNERLTAEALEKQGYPGGIVVSSVASSSPADVAGFEEDDILTVFNGKEIKTTADLIEARKNCKPGDTVHAKVYRLTLEWYGFTQRWVGSYVDLVITFE